MITKLLNIILFFKKRNALEVIVQHEPVEIYVKITADYIDINDKAVSFDASLLNVDGKTVSDTGEIINVFAINGMANLVKKHMRVGDTVKVQGVLQKTKEEQAKKFIFAKSIYKCEV